MRSDSSVFRKILTSKLFWFVCVVKMILVFTTAPDYLVSYFFPFLKNAVLHPDQNPWALSAPRLFPYGSFLFVIEYLPLWFGQWLGSLFHTDLLHNTHLALAVLKLPLFLFDVAFLALLAKLYANQWKPLLWFYWANPICLFITYFYGQMDVVPTFLCFLALYFLIRNYIKLAALSFAFAVSSKFHVLIVLPLLLAYVWNGCFLRESCVRITQFLGIFTLVCGACFIPHILAHQFGYVTLVSPEALRTFALQVPIGNNHVLFIGIAWLGLCLSRLCFSAKIDETALVYGCGILFASLLLITDAVPSWYYWFVPFLALFFIQYRQISKCVFYLFIVFYFLSWFLDEHLWPSVHSHFPANMALTGLKTILFGMILAIWVLVIRLHAPLLRRIKPTVIGIAGDSGAGKNTLSATLANLLGAKNTLLIEGDDYHKWERGHENWKTYTHLDPHSNHLQVMYEHVQHLLRGHAITHSGYDHATGKFTKPRESLPSRNLLIQGLHTFYQPKFCQLIDLKIFVDTDPLLRLAWKLDRDRTQRGHCSASILASLQSRERDAKVHIMPQRARADWVIELFPLEPLLTQDVLDGARPLAGMRHYIPKDLYTADFLACLSLLCPSLNIQTKEAEPNNDLDCQRVVLHISGSVSSTEVAHVATTVFQNLRHLTRSRREPCWEDGWAGLNQLIALLFLRELN